ncbi:MAG: hypothetical protein WDM88_01215 [Galbitalea sp.]
MSTSQRRQARERPARRHRLGRTASLVLACSVAVVGLAGCSAVRSGGFDRADARSQTAAWSQQALHAVASPPPESTVKWNGYENCRSDPGFFSTTSQWRLITYAAVASGRQSRAIDAIVRSFKRDGWTSWSSRGTVTLNGPRRPGHRGAIRLDTAGPAQIAIQVVSGCYR